MLASELSKQLSRLVDKYGDFQVVAVMKTPKSGVQLQRIIEHANVIDMKLPKYVDPTQTRSERKCVLS